MSEFIVNYIIFFSSSSPEDIFSKDFLERLEEKKGETERYHCEREHTKMGIKFAILMPLTGKLTHDPLVLRPTF